MADVGAQIRAILDDPKRFDENGNEPLIRALLAVLKTHTPWEVGDPDEPDWVCGSCRYFTSEWPCPTVDDIATELGVDCG